MKFKFFFIIFLLIGIMNFPVYAAEKTKEVKLLSNKDKAEEIFNTALKDYMTTSNNENVIKMMREVLRLDPYHQSASLSLGEYLIKNNNLEDGFRELKRHIKFYPEDSEAWSVMGNFFRKKKKNNKAALKSFLKAKKYNPENYRLNYIISNICRDMEKFTQSIKFMKAYLSDEPEDAEAHHEIADCYGEILDFENAGKYYEKTLELDPANTVVPIKLIKVYCDLGNEDEIKNFLRRFPNNSNSPVFLKTLGEVYEKFSENKKAIAAFKKAAEKYEDWLKTADDEKIITAHKEALKFLVNKLKKLEADRELISRLKKLLN